MRFNHKIVMTSSFILLLALTLLSINQYFLVKNKIQNQTNNSMNEIVQGISNTVQAEINSKKNLAMLATQLIETDIALENATKVITQAALKNEFSLIGYAMQKSGLYIASDPNLDPGSGWDPHNRPWYQQAKQAKKLIITEPYTDTVSKETLVSIGTPVIKNNEFEGAIVFDMSLTNLGKMMNKVNLFDAGFAFMITKDGTIISHPNTALNGQPILSILPDVTINQALQVVDLNNQKTMVQFKKVTGINWYVGVAINQQKVFSAVKELRNDSIIYSLISLIVGVIALSLVINRLMKPLSRINHAMADVACGNADLTTRLTASKELEFALLANNFNQFTAMLQNLVNDIKHLGHNILVDAKSTANGATNTNEAVTKQLTALENLATATNEMATTSIEVVNIAEQATEAVKIADQAAIEGALIVKESSEAVSKLSNQIDNTVTVVSQLETATHAIENILLVINGIAEQTNLLALNAAIEAARAGESGRGFAVVADEVRTLAQSTQKATTEIKVMIDQLQKGATSAVNEMTQSKHIANNTVNHAKLVDEALLTMRETIEKIVNLNIQISAATHEQSTVIEEVNQTAVNIKNISILVSNEASSVNETMINQVKNISIQEDMLEQFKA